MTAGYETILERANRMKKVLAIGATALIASVALASPAWAGTVGGGRVLTVDYTNDAVLLEGYPEGSTVTVDVLRGGASIGTFTGDVQAPAVAGDPTALEVNEAGPDLDPNTEAVIGPGDCWQGGLTPNIRPGDKVQVSVDGAVEDYTFVRNLDYEDVNGRLMGVATGNELADGSFANSPISLATTDPDAEPPTLDVRRAKGSVNSRGTILDGQISPTSGAFDVELAGTGGDVSMTFLNVTAAGGEESTVAGPFDAVAPDLGCDNAVNDPATAFVDTLAPDAPSVPDLDAASDDGASNTDNVTTNTTPTFTGTAESRSTVEILADGNVVGSGKTVAGRYSVTANVPLGPGTHDITARAIDAANNVGAESAALSVTIPQPPVVTPPPAVNAKPVISGFGPAGPTTDRTPLIGATVTDRDSVIGKGNLQLSVDNKPIAASKIKLAKVNAQTTRVSFQSGALRPGSLHKVKLVVNDKEGGIASRSWGFRVR